MNQTLTNHKKITKRIIAAIILVVIVTAFTAGCSTGNNTKSYDNEGSSAKTTKAADSEENTTAYTSTIEDVTEKLTEPSQPADENTTTIPAETQEIIPDPTQPATTQPPTQPTTTQPPTTQAPTQPATTQPPTQPTTTQPPTTQAPTQPATTQPPTQPTQEATTGKYIIDYTEDSSSKSEDYKYGIKKITTTTDYYYIYSDGSKEKYYTSSYDSYDSSGYNATDKMLLEESAAKADANISYYNEILKLVNEIRAEAGVEPLTLDTTLCQAATMRAIEIDYSNYFSHTRPDGTSCFTVFDTYSINYGWCGENIAAGQSTPQAVVTSWKNSEGHYANMINANYTKLGVGMSNEGVGDYRIYWVQLFTS